MLYSRREGFANIFVCCVSEGSAMVMENIRMDRFEKKNRPFIQAEISEEERQLFLGGSK